LLKSYGQAVGSNLESLGRGGVASVIGAGGDLESLGRMGINKLYGAGGVNVNPTPVLPTTTDILGMIPRATAPRQETAGMEELGGYMTPATAKVLKPAVMATGRMAGQEIANVASGMPSKSLLGDITPKPKKIFIGENAQTWDKAAADQAVEMEKAGAKPTDIWSATGTFRGPEGKLRQEISDKYSTIKGGGNFEDVIMKAYDLGVERTKGTGQREYWQPYKTTVEDVLFHKNLAEAYPELMKIESQLTPNGTKARGQLMLTDKDLIMQIRPDLQSKQAESTMLHELQHGVQEKEGFAKGANPSGPYASSVREQMIRNQFEQLKEATKYDPTNPYSSPNTLTDEELLLMAIRNTDAENGVGRMQAYRLSAGEAEARAVQNRMNMTDAERRAKFPYESYDVPINNLIVTK